MVERVLLLHGGGTAHALAETEFPDAFRARFGADVPDERWAAVCVVATDVSHLRRVVAGLREAGRTARLVVVLEQPATTALTIGRVGNNAALAECRSTRRRLDATFTGPVPTRKLLLEVVRRTGRRLLAPGWPVVGLDASLTRWPPGDPGAHRPTDEEAPDLVLVGGDGPRDAWPLDEPDPVSGRPPVVVRPRDELLVGPVDDQLLNPIGFRQAVGPALRLRDVPALHSGCPQVARKAQAIVTTPPREPEMIWLRRVAGLAMAGVPIVLDQPLPPDHARLLGPRLAETLPVQAPPEDPVEREVLSVRQRRAAHATFSPSAWRARLAAEAGLAVPRLRVSVLLCTRRPAQVDFALRQIGRQRVPDDVELEVVLACHGFEAPTEPATCAGLPGDVVPVEVPGDVPFGEALNRASRHATGDLLLKMDDDDWYAEEFLADLLLARRYSGADVVGVPQMYFHVLPEDRTVRFQWAVECFAWQVAGGSMLIDRGAFADLGGFRPVRKHVDAELLRAVADAGGTTFRTHGLGYLCRRQGAGHTWSLGNEEILGHGRVIENVPGFVPPALLTVEPGDRPVVAVR